MLRLTVSQKIAAGYLLVVVFCFAAVVYALAALNSVTRRAERLVAVEFKTFTLAGDLSRSILAHERLEKQLMVLRDATMLALLENRRQDIENFWKPLKPHLPQTGFQEMEDGFAAFEQFRAESWSLLGEEQWQAAEAHSTALLSPQRNRLLEDLAGYRQARERSMDDTMRHLVTQSRQGYRLTLALAFVGIGLAVPVAAGLILKIHRAMDQLRQATRAIAAGDYGYPLALEGHDEFGHLARHFADMALKLRDLEQHHLDANPLTRLPGNLVIRNELERRIASGSPFAHIYIDLDYFKAYNDRYGYAAGSEVILRVGDLVRRIGADYGNPEDLIGHIGGDDYILLSTPERAEQLARELIKGFDAMVPEFYTEEDRRRGYFSGEDRYGDQRRFPLLSMSIAVVCTRNLANPTPETIGKECAKMKEHLKTLPGSNFLIDRRELRK